MDLTQYLRSKQFERIISSLMQLNLFQLTENLNTLIIKDRSRLLDQVIKGYSPLFLQYNIQSFTYDYNNLLNHKSLLSQYLTNKLNCPIEVDIQWEREIEGGSSRNYLYANIKVIYSD